MRQSARTAILVVTSLIATVGLWVASAFAAALAFGAIAIIVPGTGTPNANVVSGYMQNARDRFINPSGGEVCTGEGCLTGVNYPASFWPIPLPGWCPNLRCDTWNASVGLGVDHLLDAIEAAPEDEDIVAFGYSQGGAVVSRAMYEIPQDEWDRITVVTIGNINNPQGLWSRLSFLPYIPGLNISFGPQLPTDGINSINYTFEYDPVGDAPLYWGNPLAVLNALMAFEYVHGYYLVPNGNGPDETLPYGYDPDTFPEFIDDLPLREYGNAQFGLIPWQGTLPLFQPFVDLGNATGTSAFIDPVVRLLQPATKLLIDLGYDRAANPGIPRTLSVLPFNPLTFDPIEFSVDFVEAVFQGIHDAVNGPAIAVPAPPAEETRDALAGEAFARLAADEVQDAEEGETAKSASVTDLDETEPVITAESTLDDADLAEDGAVVDDTVTDLKPADDVVTDGGEDVTDPDATEEETLVEDLTESDVTDDDFTESGVTDDNLIEGDVSEEEGAGAEQQDEDPADDANDVDKDEPAADAANEEAPAAA